MFENQREKCLGSYEVLGKYAVSTLGVFLYFPNRKQISPKLRAFIEHASEFAASSREARDSVVRRRRNR